MVFIQRQPPLICSLFGMAIWLLGISRVFGYEESLHSARQMLEQDNAQAAYEEIKATETEYGGEPEFDYWLGVIALRAGEVSHALIALDRVLITQPRHAGARMERAAALLQLDQRSAAEQEIERLEALSPPPEAQAAIRRFKAEINRRRQKENSPQHNVSVGVALSYDTNPQRYQNDITLDPLPPALRSVVDQLIDSGALEPDDPTLLEEATFTSRSSFYHRWNARYQGRFPIDKHSRWLMSVTAQTQRYLRDSANEIDLTLVQFAPGYQRELDNGHSMTLEPSLLQGWSGADQHPLLTRWGLTGRYTYPVGTDSELAWQLSAQHNDFDNDQSDYDAGRLDATLTTPLKNIDLRWQAQLGREWARRSDTDQKREGGDLNHWRLGLGVDVPISRRQLIRGDIGYRQRDYQDDINNITTRYEPRMREEKIWETRLSWLYQLNRHWLVETSVDYEKRNTTLDFYDSTRFQTQIGVRYLF